MEIKRYSTGNRPPSYAEESMKRKREAWAKAREEQNQRVQEKLEEEAETRRARQQEQCGEAAELRSQRHNGKSHPQVTPTSEIIRRGPV